MIRMFQGTAISKRCFNFLLHTNPPKIPNIFSGNSYGTACAGQNFSQLCKVPGDPPVQLRLFQGQLENINANNADSPAESSSQPSSISSVSSLWSFSHSSSSLPASQSYWHQLCNQVTWDGNHDSQHPSANHQALVSRDDVASSFQDLNGQGEKEKVSAL